jgi:hypothetical protein
MVVNGDVSDSNALGQYRALAGAREIQNRGLCAAQNSQQKQTLKNQ